MGRGQAGLGVWQGMDTQLSPSWVAHLAWLLFTLSGEMCGQRKNAAASPEHLPWRSKMKTIINQNVSTAVPIHKGAEIRLWILCNCFIFKERRRNKSVGCDS